MTSWSETAPTGPFAWRAALEARQPRGIDAAGLGRLLVVAAHPDDETLGAGGLMQAVHHSGGQIDLVVATDGEAAFPGLDHSARVQLGRRRRAELHRSMRSLGLGSVRVHWLGMPDSALDHVALSEALRPLIGDAEAYLAPWCGDPHPDHAAAGRAAAAVAPVSVHGWHYPIWTLAWQRPDDPGIPWSRAFQYALTGAQRERKRRAVGCFASQLAATPEGGPPVLPASALRYFDTDRELFFRSPPRDSAPLQRFSQLYTHGDGDPWRTRSSWYEKRKRNVVLASLPRARYRHAAEPGCGLGALTRELASRCDRVTASDGAPEAVTAAAVETRHLPGVTVDEIRLPDPEALPDELDLVVLSEVLYYLSSADIGATVDRVADALAAGGDLVLAHWRGWPAEAPVDAVQAHGRAVADQRFDVVVEHVDADFLLHVLRRR